MENITQDLLRTSPIVTMSVTGLIVILINAFRKNSENVQFVVSLLGIATGIGYAWWTLSMTGSAFNGMVLTGGYASIFSMLFLVAAGLTLFLARDYIRKVGTNFGEFYIIIIFATAGMMTFATSLDLISMFIGLELMSICLYVLAGFTRKELKSNEAALKYFLLGAFATGFFLYGVALIYGTTGTTNIEEITASISVYESDLLFLVGVGLLLIGFGFKIGAVPFHMWVPDVYEGSPSVVTAFMSTGAKAAAFGALVLVFTATFNFTHGSINNALAILAVASMVIGNVVAISQSNIKRMLAYSSIAHAGYMLIGITAGSDLSINGVIFYLVSYTLTNLGAFGIVSLVENEQQQNTQISSFNGLGQRNPVLAALMSLFLFSLIGIPPLSGFFGKYYIFYAAIQQGFTWLTVIGVLTSMVSVYYYLRVIVAMYFTTTEETTSIRSHSTSMFSLLVSASGIVVIGLLPRLILDWTGKLF